MDKITRILIVDGDPNLLQIHSRLLKSVGYQVVEAGMGQDGLRLAKETRPDLILLDVVLPDIDGITVCRRIKADPALTGSFVILFSGLRTASEDQAGGLEAGADGYIARPISNREFLARVQALLRIKRTEDALRESEVRFRELFSNMSSGVVVYEVKDGGRDIRIRDINAAGEWISRVRREDVVGKSILEVFPGVREFGLLHVLQRVWRTGEPERLPAGRRTTSTSCPPARSSQSTMTSPNRGRRRR
jgi:DNA-binding response OmpR family regulator